MRPLITLTFVCLTILGYCQNVKPYFTAIIVEDIELSKTWYAENFGFSVLNEMANEENGFKQANLQLGDGILLELLEIKGVSNKNAEGELKELPRFSPGLFKIGFLVKDFDQKVNDLRVADVEFHGDIVRDQKLNKRMVIIKDPDGNFIQLFEN
ncbi:VOC family protein [Ekhidna sp.]|uniref:VOC family protein n=1 Tax=Ekhidna sp. TaxID=2608089 RepID=UPI003C7D9B64